MSLTAAVLQKMLDKGLTLADVVEIAEVWEAGAAEPVPALDPREAKRAYDRERMRLKREAEHVARQSYDIVSDVADDTATAPPSPSFSPQTPLNHPHPPGDINTRARPSIGKPNGFARFWEAYPNKTGKIAAEKAFAKACAQIGDHDPLAVLLAGIERSRSSREWREGYVPHPTTWLNRGSWDDQPAEIIQLQPQGSTHVQRHPNQSPSPREDRLGRMLRGAMAAVDERTTGLD